MMFGCYRKSELPSSEENNQKISTTQDRKERRRKKKKSLVQQVGVLVRSEHCIPALLGLSALLEYRVQLVIGFHVSPQSFEAKSYNKPSGRAAAADKVRERLAKTVGKKHLNLPGRGVLGTNGRAFPALFRLYRWVYFYGAVICWQRGFHAVNLTTSNRKFCKRFDLGGFRLAVCFIC